QDNHRFDGTHSSQQLRKKIALVFVRAMLTAQAKGLTGRACCKQANSPPKCVPADFLNIFFKYRCCKRAAHRRIVTQRLACLLISFVNRNRREAAKSQAERKSTCTCEQVNVEFRKVGTTVRFWAVHNV